MQDREMQDRKMQDPFTGLEMQDRKKEDQKGERVETEGPQSLI